ncbi:MAG: cbb3-type cytochrome c oxidase subunit I [Myxococcota bacterium]
MSQVSTQTASQEAAQQHGGSGVNYLNHSSGLSSWLFTLDHKRIGVLYLISVLTAFLLGGFFALGLRLELLTPQQDFMTAETYNKFFTLHGAIMVFLFIIPSIPGALGNFVLPIQLGAKDVAFPRLNLMSLYIYVFGALFAVYSLITSAVDTGWTFYTPYSTTTDTSVISMVMGAFILGFSSIFTGMNFIATVHKLRAPGMTMFRMPLMIWALYATAIIQVLATPVLAITLLLLVVERSWGIGIFDPAMGGDPILFQHFFWFYSHPAVYIMILPGMGIISELIAAFSRKTVFGYRAVALSSIALALLGFLVWGHHLFVSGQSEWANVVFSFLTFFVAIPSAIKVFNWLATLYRGSISFETPMLYALAFMFLFTIGGLTGVVLGALSTNIHLTDTYFVIAHFHYVMMGGTVIAFVGGLHYWWPKMTGRMYNETWGKIACAIIFFGFNLTFFVQFIMGAKGMPRRYYSYVPEYQPYHILSTVGTWFLGLGFTIILVYLLASLKRGAIAPANPWGALTLEWTHTASPPIHENFTTTPVVEGGPYDYPDET